MKRLLSYLTILVVAAPAVLAQQPAAPQPIQPQQGNPAQTAEWVKEMRNDGMKMLADAEAALAKGDDATALNKYTAAHEIYKAAFSADELKSMADKIMSLRTKLGVAGHEQPAAGPAKVVDLNDPAVASKRTDAMRLLSEAEQYLEEGKFQDSGKLFTKLYSRFRPVLLAEEEQRVTQGLMTSRERLGLPPLPPGQADFLPYIAKSGDDEIDSLCLLMSGSFATAAKGVGAEGVKLVFNSGAVPVEGLTNAVYFEVAREDDQPNPFRQGILTVYRMDQQLRLRVLDIPTAGIRNTLVGLWAATDVFPSLPLDSLTVNSDLALSRNTDGSGYTAHTTGRVPTTKGGAVFMTSQVKVTADGISIDDRGFDASGKEVWRSGDEGGVMFLRTAAPSIVTRRESGVVVIDLVSGSGDTGLTKGGEVAMHFSYWAATGTMVGTSRIADRPPQRVRYPINFIPGLDEGLDGIKPNTRRRFIIPPELAWGAQGNNWQVPPNTAVVFDVECLWVQGPLTPPTPTPVEGGGEQGPPAPQPPTPETPKATGGGH